MVNTSLKLIEIMIKIFSHKKTSQIEALLLGYKAHVLFDLREGLKQ